VQLEGVELEEYRRQEKEKEMEATRLKQEHSRKYVLLILTVCFRVLFALLSHQLFVSSKIRYLSSVSQNNNNNLLASFP